MTDPCRDIDLEGLVASTDLEQDPTGLPEEAQAHLASCERCAAELTRLRLLETRLSRLDADFELSEDFMSDLLAEVPERPSPARRPRHRAVVWACAASLLVGLGGLVWFAQHQPAATETAPTTTPAPRLAGEVVSSSGSLRVQRPGGTWERLDRGAHLQGPLALQSGVAGVSRLRLEDGSQLRLDRRTKLDIDAQGQLQLRAGRLLATVLPKGRLRVGVPQGRVDVSGAAKIQLRAGERESSVAVVRGRAQLRDAEGHVTDVAAAQQGLLAAATAGTVSRVGPAPDLGRMLRWSYADRDVDGARQHTAMAGLGSLSAQRPGERRARPLRLESHVIQARVAGAVARTEIRQTFANDSGHTLEGIYRFPLPPGARISRLALIVDGRVEEGTIVERGRGRRIWRGVLRQATPRKLRKVREDFVWVPGPWKDPALLEWREGNRFELRIFPIPPRSTRTVILAYTETLPLSPRGRRYVYPLPHPRPGEARSLAAGRFELSLRVDGAAGINAHPYELRSTGAKASKRWRLEARDFMPRGDLVVDLVAPRAGRKAGEDKALEVHAYRDPRRPDEAGWVLLSLRSRLPASGRERRPRDLVLVVDRSLSALGEASRRQLRLLRAFAEELGPDDRVRLLACDSACTPLGEGFVPAARLGALVGALERHHPGGATDLGAALRQALGQLQGRDPLRRGHVVLIGDGVATAGERRPGRVASLLRGELRRTPARVSAVGLGTSVDALMLRTLSRAGGGVYVPYTPGLSARGQALRLFAELSGAALERPELTLPAGFSEIVPRRLPTLRHGQELFVAARLSRPIKGVAVLHGSLHGRPHRQLFTLDVRPGLDPAAAFVPRLWAQLALEERSAGAARASGAEARRLRASVVQLSRRYRLLSRYTSLLVLESEAMRRAFKVRAPSGGVDATAFGGSLGHGGLGDRGLGGGAGGAQAQLDTAAGRGYGRGRLATKGARRARRGIRDLASVGTKRSSSGVGKAGRHWRRGVPGERVPPPSLSRRRPAVRGALDKSLIQRSIRRQLPQLRRVFERQLKSNPRAVGRTRLRFVIGPSGRVVAAHIGGNAAFRQAVQRVVRRWRFPAPAGGGTVTVVYPLVFSASGVTGPSLGKPSSPRPTPRKPGTRVPPVGIAHRPWRPVGRRRSWRLMRRVRTTVAELRRAPYAEVADGRRVDRARQRLAAAPRSRDATRALYRALSRAGRAAEALRALETWLAKEPRSREALTLLVDAAGRAGQERRALRALGSLVELGARSPRALRRAGRAWRLAGDEERACAFYISLGEVSSTGRPMRLSEACRAGRRLPRLRSAGRLRLRVSTRGTGTKLEVALVDTRGRRWSWLSGRWGVRAGERLGDLGLRWLPAGRYRVEVRRRAEGKSAAPQYRRLRGTLRLRWDKQRLRRAFSFSGPRAYVAELRLRRETRLMPVVR